MRLEDLSNKAIREFLGCSVVFASYIRMGKRRVPKRKRDAFALRFGISVIDL